MKLLVGAISTTLALTCLAPFAGASSMTTPSSIVSNFNGTSVPGGDEIWFSAVVKLTGSFPTNNPIDIYITGSTITSSAFSIDVPNATLTFSPSATMASTSYSSSGWDIVSPFGTSGNTLVDAVEFAVPASGLAGGLNPVTWTADFSTNTPGITLDWQWAAAAYSSFSQDYNALGVQPTDDGHASPYGGSDHAGTPENFKTYVVGGARGGGGSNYTGSLSATASVTPAYCNVPEPSYAALAGLFLVALGAWRRRRPAPQRR
jgi:MYXO-CTERM domain-containing protein